MKEYHKIPNLYKFDEKTHKHIIGDIYDESVELLKNCKWAFTEKIDGMNFRIHWDGHKLTYAGRTDNATFSAKQIEFITNNLLKEELFEQTFMEKQATVYGELYGSGIQNGGLYSNDIQFSVFDIEIEDIFLNKESMDGLAYTLGYNSVPLVCIGTIEDGVNFVIKNEQSVFSKAKLEGVVGVPLGGFRNRLGKRIIVKIKRKDLNL